MKKLFAALVAATMLCAPMAVAQAQSQCVPLAALAIEITNAGIPAENVFITKDVSVVNSYLKALDLTIPDGSEPIGMVTVVVPHQDGMPDRVFIAVVEPGQCIRHTAVMPLERHKAALTAALTGV